MSAVGGDSYWYQRAMEGWSNTIADLRECEQKLEEKDKEIERLRAAAAEDDYEGRTGRWEDR